MCFVQVAVLLEGSPLSTEELWFRFGLRGGGGPVSGKVLLVLYFFDLQGIEASWLIGTFRVAERQKPPDQLSPHCLYGLLCLGF